MPIVLLTETLLHQIKYIYPKVYQVIHNASVKVDTIQGVN